MSKFVKNKTPLKQEVFLLSTEVVNGLDACSAFFAHRRCEKSFFFKEEHLFTEKIVLGNEKDLKFKDKIFKNIIYNNSNLNKRLYIDIIFKIKIYFIDFYMNTMYTLAMLQLLLYLRRDLK